MNDAELFLDGSKKKMNIYQKTAKYFFEVDSRVENQLFMGRDPDYAISTETIEFGDSFSIILSAHITRVEKLNLIPLRGGKYPSTNKLNGGNANEIG